MHASDQEVLILHSTLCLFYIGHKVNTEKPSADRYENKLSTYVSPHSKGQTFKGSREKNNVLLSGGDV